MRARGFSFLAVTLLSSFVYASGPGTGSADFLKIPVGARETSLGGAFTAVADNANAIYYNPAGLSLLQNPEISFTHNSYVKGVSQQWFAGAYPCKSGTFGAGLNYLSVGAFDAYDNADNPTGSVSAYDMAAYFSYGRRLSGDYKAAGSISYGASLKYIRERLDTRRADGFGVDLGFLIEPHIKNLRFGLGVENIVSSKLKFIDEGVKPPLKLKTGVSYRIAPGDPVSETLFTVDFNFPKDGANYTSAGVESRFYKTFALRFGYSSSGDISNGYNFGLGFDLSRYIGKSITVDYSFGSTYDFGDINKLGVSCKFGSVRLPIAPVAPTAPVKQLGSPPIAPTTPVAPIAPEPVTPITSTAPVEQVAPTVPVESVGPPPVAPTTPIAPMAPIAPEPVVPSTSTAPVFFKFLE